MSSQVGSDRRVAPVPRLYAIADQDAYASRPLDEVAAELAEAGVGWIQLRAKGLSDRALYDVVERTVRRLEGSRARVWINDRPDIAACFAVAGVHLGQDDLPPEAARRILGERVWIGRSTHDPEQARQAAADPAIDVVAIGPVFRTASKESPDPAGGLELVRRARRVVHQPLVAIGGIEAETAVAVLETGADAVAVIAALARGGSPGRSARAFLAALAGA